MNRPVIALTGVARSGKDKFCHLARKEFSRLGVKARRLAFADPIKKRLNMLLRPFDIDLFDCPDATKTMCRPLMVEFGKVARSASKGTYWWKIAREKIRRDASHDLFIITDCRYDEYDEDELYFVKTLMGGELVYIERTLECGIKMPPANPDEERNDERLRRAADQLISWVDDDEKTLVHRYVRPAIERIYEKHLKKPPLNDPPIPECHWSV